MTYKLDYANIFFGILAFLAKIKNSVFLTLDNCLVDIYIDVSEM